MNRFKSVIFLLGIALSTTGVGYSIWAYTQGFQPAPVPEEVLSAAPVASSTTSSSATSTTTQPVERSTITTQPQATTSTTSTTTTTTVPQTEYGKPSHLTIEKIGVDDPLVPTKLGPEGEFEAEPFTVAWYSGSVWPGQPGPMLIGAHVAWRDKGPDRFARLTELRPGDTFALKNELGETFEYVVTDLYQIGKEKDFSAFINEVVWVESKEHVLWLNTCGGELRPTGSFADNIFVRAELIPEEGS